MTHPDDDDDILVQNAVFAAREESAGGPQEIVDALARGLARQRHALWIVVLGLLLDIGLSVAVGIAFVHISHNAATAHTVCVQTNDSRAKAKAIWSGVLAGADTSTPAARARIKKIRDLVAKTYTPRNCN